MPVSGDLNLPVHPDPDREWNSALARRRLRVWASKDGSGLPSTIDWEKYRRAFAWYDTTGEALLDFKLPYAEPVDPKSDEITIIPRAVKAIAGGHGVGGMGGDQQELETRICKLYAVVARTHSEFPDCPFERERTHGHTAAIGDDVPDDTETTDEPAAEPAREGVAVMAFLAPGDATALAVDGGEPPEDLHCTLAYLAQPAASFDETARADVQSAVAGAWQGPVTVVPFGVALFNQDDPERDTSLNVLVQSADLAALHDRMTAALPEQDDTFPCWVPHVNLLYQPEGMGEVEVPPELTLDRVVVAWGDEQVDVTSATEDDMTEMTMDGVEPMVAAASGPPVGDRGRSWDAAAARSRLFAAATKDDKMDTAYLHRAFLWVDPDMDSQDHGAWKLPFADVVDGTLTIIPAAVMALAGGHGVGATKGASGLESKVCALYGRVRAKYEDFPDCPLGEKKSMTASAIQDDNVVAAGGVVGGQVFDLADFTEPSAEQGSFPLTLYPDGKIVGYVAAKGSCHLDYKGQCKEAPLASPSGFARFHVSGARLGDGSVLPVGVLTLGPGHESRGSLTASRDHYANVATVAAKVRVGSNEHGTWFAGRVVDDVMPRADDLLLAPVSGHWEPDPDSGGALELIAVHVVNTPGYFTPRELVASGGEDTAFVVASLGENGVRAKPISIVPEIVQVPEELFNQIQRAMCAAIDGTDDRKAHRIKVADVTGRARQMRVDKVRERLTRIGG